MYTDVNRYVCIAHRFLSLSVSLGLWHKELTHMRLSLAGGLTTTIPWMVALLTSHARRGALSEKTSTKSGRAQCHAYFVGRSATSGQAIVKKSLPPFDPKTVLIDWLTRVPAAGIPYHKTRSSMWNGTGIFHRRIQSGKTGTHSPELCPIATTSGQRHHQGSWEITPLTCNPTATAASSSSHSPRGAPFFRVATHIYHRSILCH